MVMDRPEVVGIGHALRNGLFHRWVTENDLKSSALSDP